LCFFLLNLANNVTEFQLNKNILKIKIRPKNFEL